MSRKCVRNRWSDSQLKAALCDIHAGKSGVRAAARKYCIPHSTLYDHLSGKSKKRYGGPPTVLTPEEEKEITTSCIVLQEFGFPLTKETVGVIVSDLLKDTRRETPFTNGLPGHDWWTRFLGRWPVLSQRKPQHLPKNRAVCTTSAVRKHYKK